MLFLLLQLLALMIFLIVIGEPLRVLFLRRLKFFADLDLLQKSLLDVYLGGLVLFVIAMLPLQLFERSIVIGLTIIGFFISLSIHLRRLHKDSINQFRVYLMEHKMEIFDYVLVLAMFSFLLWIQLIPLVNFVFGSIHDTSLHSLMVEVILENRLVPMTLQPYLPEGIIYPQASHVIFAYASHTIGYEAPKAVFYVTPLFNALSVLGAYFLGKKMWSNRGHYLGFSFVFAFVSSWPLYITWGANPFITGFPLFLVCLGLFFSIIHSKAKNGPKELIATGILFGYSAVIIISYLEALTIIGFFWLIYRYIRKTKSLRSMLKSFLLILFASVLPLSSFLSRFIMFFQYPGRNIGIASGFMGYEKFQPKLTQALEWALGNLNPNPVLRVELIGLLVGLGFLLWKVRKGTSTKKVLGFMAAIFFSSTLLSFISYFLPADLSVISWPHQSIILTVPLSASIVVFHNKLALFLQNRDLNLLLKVFSKRSHAVFLITVTSFAAINIPFIYSRFATDAPSLAGAYSLFAITTEDDYKLMRWMKNNLPQNSTILINPFEAGLFVPSTSHRVAIFPYVASQRAFDYQRLANLLSQDIVNLTTFELMKSYNITHIFVGAYATYWWSGDYKWNPLIFLGNPNFKLLKKFGESYLFETSLFDPKIALLDEFDYENLMDVGWALGERGLGAGEVKITSMNGDSCLFLNATNKANGDLESLYFYELQAGREVYLDDISNVTLSFYLNMSSGFGQLDAIAIVVSNIWANMSICFATPNSLFQNWNLNQTRMFRLENREGNFIFNLSESWFQVYGSDLPNKLLLQIRNLDVDGVPNLAFLDSLMISQ